MTHFDLFSGYGGFTLSLEKVYGISDKQSTEVEQDGKRRNGDADEVESDVLSAGRTTPLCIGFSEIDKYASAVLKYRWPNIKNYGDISKINWAAVPDFDLLTGGSPCQDLSIAGKRAGLAGQRSGLFYEYMRAVKEKKPKYFIWENVKGALSSSQGWDFGFVLNEMAEAGYSLWWQVLNAKDFGVPQNRERIFVIGFRDGSPREVFFERGDDQAHIGKEPSQSRRILKSPTKILEDFYPNRVREFDHCPTLRSDRAGLKVKEDYRIRRLTPTECERLMGLPDDWTSKGIIDGKEVDISDSQRYKLCGNGVVVNVVEEIIKNLIAI